MKRIILQPGEERRIQQGHPWVYDNEIAAVLEGFGEAAQSATLTPGEVADIESSGKNYLGRAIVNPHSRITARIYSPSKEGMDKGFFKRRIREAILRRAAAGIDLTRESARIVFAEADLLPGLIVDRFAGWPLEAAEAAVTQRPMHYEAVEAALGKPASWLAVQFLCWGMDERREMILDALHEVLAAPLAPGQECLGAPMGVVEKSNVPVRELETLPLYESLARGSYPPSGILMFENGLAFAVHIEEGQKTGHYLDQKDNRRRAAACLGMLPAGTARVLDTFAYSGGFGINAARAGAASVLCVDASAAALEAVKINAALNGVSAVVTTVQANVFGYLRETQRGKTPFDIVVLDPPAFAKTKASLEGATRGYKEINLRAIQMIAPGGILVSCSCSQAVDSERFRRIITSAAADSGKRLTELDFFHQPPDHPVLMGYEESLYLKCGIYRVL